MCVFCRISNQDALARPTIQTAKRVNATFLARESKDPMTPNRKTATDSKTKTASRPNSDKRSYKAPSLAKVEKLAQVTGAVKVTGPTDGLGKIG